MTTWSCWCPLSGTGPRRSGWCWTGDGTHTGWSLMITHDYKQPLMETTCEYWSWARFLTAFWKCQCENCGTLPAAAPGAWWRGDSATPAGCVAAEVEAASHGSSISEEKSHTSSRGLKITFRGLGLGSSPRSDLHWNKKYFYDCKKKIFFLKIFYVWKKK